MREQWIIENSEKFLVFSGSYGKFYRAQVRRRAWVANDLEGL